MKVNCYQCKTPICLDDEHYAKLKETGDTFWCPRGHGQHFAESELSRLKKRVEQLEKEVRWYSRHTNELYARIDSMEKSRNAYRMLYGKAKKHHEQLTN